MNLLNIEDYSIQVPGKNDFFIKELILSPGEIFQIKGESGSGKSLFLKSLLGFWSSTFKKVEFKDSLVSDLKTLRGRVAYIPNRLPLSLNIVRNELDRVSEFSSSNSNLQFELLKHLNLDDRFLDKSVRQLSGGETQLLNLLRALCVNPELFLFDESFSSMDSIMRKKVSSFISDILVNEKKAALEVSHT